MNNAIKNQLLTLVQRVMIFLCLPAILLLSNCETRSKLDTTILEKKPTKKELIEMVERLNESEVMEGFVRIKADVRKVDRLWTDRSFRISTYNNIENKGKYIASREDLWNGKVNRPPEISYEDNKVDFYNGRHRFANLRDMGAEYIYVDIDDEEVSSIIEWSNK